MAEKPTAAFVLSLIGGIFLLLGGILVTVGFSLFLGSLGALFGIVGIIFALLVIIGAVMMYNKPEKHTMWGVIVLVFSIIALPAIWGFGIGSLLGFIGGILALVFKPSMAPTAMPPSGMGSMPTTTMGSTGSMGGMTCRNCGASIPAGAMKCPSCGANI